MKKKSIKSKIVKSAVKMPVTFKKQAIHWTENYIVNPAHPVTVNVVGCGGTGSQVLNSLARMHSALKSLGHPGLYVRAIDPDKVSEANLGRQLFSPADINSYKCVALIGRINRFFGYDWEAVPKLYNTTSKVPSANITISCVDTGRARKEIKNELMSRQPAKTQDTPFRKSKTVYMHPYLKPYYWMDFGNMKDRGQVVLGTIMKITQPKESEFDCIDTLPTIDKFHPDIFKDDKKDDQGPSCSLAEALGKQDLFINTNLANMGLGILWKMFRELRIKYHGLYVNLDTLTVNPIKV